jgi:N-acetylglutamate synthase-like GNAT family acetyltransferase
LAAALAKEGLPADDLQSAHPLFWRFESDALPVGFGGLEIFGSQALLRSLVTLPPVRGRGIGGAMVAALEMEARIRGCRTVWLLTHKAANFFARLGYRACERAEAPKPIREAAHFARPASASAMMKRLD